MTKRTTPDACSAEEERAMLAATGNPVGVLFDPAALWRGGGAKEVLPVQPGASRRRSPGADGVA